MSSSFPTRHLAGHGAWQVVRIFFGVLRSSLVVAWFASVYGSIACILAGILGKPTVMIVGGVDLAKDRDLHYGIWLSPWRSRIVGTALRRATRVLAVDRTLMAEVKVRADYDGANVDCLPTGYDARVWKPAGKKQDTILTVAVAHDIRRAKLKGIDTLVAAARGLPSTRFDVVGVNPLLARPLLAPENVFFHPPVPREELLPWYREAKIYCQPSRREGLPNSLCEAMLCGCYPVVTNVGGNVNAVGETGIVVPLRDAGSLVRALRRAMKMNARAGNAARKRIARLFPKAKRVKGLIGLVKELTA